jgi:predicted small metal-binding protein
MVGERVSCDCGYEAVAGDERTLVAEIRQHAWEAHGLELTNEEALVVILRHALVSSTSGPAGDPL